jgi:hypothetical protein
MAGRNHGAATAICRKLVTERDQGRVRQAACESDRKHMLAQQALAQDEGVLRADREDQAEACQEACYGNRKAHAPRSPVRCGSRGDAYRLGEFSFNSIDTLVAMM